MKSVEIHHISETGNARTKILHNVFDVVYDYGFELNGVQTPAIKLLSKSDTPYYLRDVWEPEKLTEVLKTSKGNVVLDIDIFDPELISFKEAMKFLKYLSFDDFLREVNMKCFMETEALKMFTVKEVWMFVRGDGYPVLNLNREKLAGHWAERLPTPFRPKNVSRKQYFNVILQNYYARHHHERYRL